jgi:putative lipoic acid-binding regulatory protein
VSETDAPRITFPCDDYPVKVVARTSDDLRARLDAVFARHFGTFDAARVVARDSARQNFISFTYLVHVNDPSQLAAVHAELMKETGVVMVL